MKFISIGVSRWAGLLVLSALLAISQGCDKLATMGRAGLQPGINYMQPLKWRMTCYYRVQEIFPERPFVRAKKSAFNPDIPAVGPGSYEVWMVVPREGEELFNVTEVYSHPAPTEIASTPNGDAKFYYFNFTPDGNLPKDLTAAVQWEFITFERYGFFEDFVIGEYDKESELYKTYTKAEKPITTHHPEMQKQAKKCVSPDYPDDTIMTAHSCYDYILSNFRFDANLDDQVINEGRVRLQDTWRSWENKSGYQEEYANTFCAMLRSLGIPARPCTGLFHPADNRDTDGSLLLEAQSNTWAEFYVPDAGWVPVDPALGQHTGQMDMLISRMGKVRDLSLTDYYFGKHDALRIPYNKHWNLKLMPAPKTPGADPIEPWTLGFAHRFSGILEMRHGWEGEPGTFGGG